MQQATPHLSPAAHDVHDIPTAHAEVHDAPVDGLAGPLGGEVLLGHLQPPERPHGEADGAAGLGELAPHGVTAPPGIGGETLVNPLTPRRTQVSPFTEISILF